MDTNKFLEQAEATLHNQQIGLFATKTCKELEAYIEQFSGSEQAVAALIYGLTWNTAMQAAAKILERDYRHPPLNR